MFGHMNILYIFAPDFFFRCCNLSVGGRVKVAYHCLFRDSKLKLLQCSCKHEKNLCVSLGRYLLSRRVDKFDNHCIESPPLRIAVTGISCRDPITNCR